MPCRRSEAKEVKLYSFLTTALGEGEQLALWLLYD
jgi:hypothetical protein